MKETEGWAIVASIELFLLSKVDSRLGRGVGTHAYMALQQRLVRSQKESAKKALNKGENPYDMIALRSSSPI